MRHKVDGRKLGRTSSHRKAMLNNMAVSLFKHERIQTTLPKAKELRRFAEKLITRAKDDSTHSRRIVFRSIRDKAVIDKLFSEIAPRFADRNGGYTRILKLDYRMADAAPTAIIELVGSEDVKKKKDKKADTAKAKAKPAKADKKKPDVEQETVKAEVSDPSATSDAVFKKGKARDGAREAFMDKLSEEEQKQEKKKKIFDKWRKKETEDEVEEKKESPKAEKEEPKKEEPKAEAKVEEKKAEKEEEPKVEAKEEVKTEEKPEEKAEKKEDKEPEDNK